MAKSDALVQKCEVCHGPVTISYQELTETKQIIRKATCPDARCAARTWQRMKMAKRNLRCYKLFCKLCRQETQVLTLSPKGLVCQSCAKEQRESMHV